MRRERERGKKRKEKRKKEPFFFLFFPQGSHVCFTRGSRAPRTSSLSSFFFSLSLPFFDAAQNVFRHSTSPKACPSPVTRLFSSPDSKEITIYVASCRCGRGEKRKKEDALLGVSIQGPSRRKHCALSTPAQAFFPLKTSSVAKDGYGTVRKSRDQKPRPLPPEPRKRRRGFERCDFGSFDFFVVEISNGRKTKRSPARSSQSRARRAPRAAGAHLLWIAWRRF